jgi:hypothetical protein
LDPPLPRRAKRRFGQRFFKPQQGNFTQRKQISVDGHENPYGPPSTPAARRQIGDSRPWPRILYAFAIRPLVIGAAGIVARPDDGLHRLAFLMVSFFGGSIIVDLAVEPTELPWLRKFLVLMAARSLVVAAAVLSLPK